MESKKKKKEPITNIRDLLREVYLDGKVRKDLNDEEKKIVKASTVVEVGKEELLAAATKDQTLKLTLELLILNLHVGSKGITHFVQEILKEHPAFREKNVDLTEEFLRGIALLDYEKLSWPSDLPPLPNLMVSEYRSNTILCFILLLWFNDESIDYLISRLREFCWEQKQERRSNVSDVEKVKILLKGSDSLAFSLIFDQLKGEIESLRLDKQNVERRIATTENALRESQIVNKQYSAEIQDRTDALQSLRREFELFKQRSADKYETLRGRVRGRLSEDIKLLDNGLHALKRDQPILKVMLEYGNRVVNSLKEEFDQLEE